MRWLSVIARGSSFRFRRRGPRSRGTALGARYVLSGIIESAAAALSRHLELTDMGRREVIWGDRLTSPMDGIDDLRQRIVSPAGRGTGSACSRERGAKCGPAFGRRQAGCLGELPSRPASPLPVHAPTIRPGAGTISNAPLPSIPPLARAHAGLSFTSFLEAFLHLGRSRSAAQAQRGGMRNAVSNSTRWTPSPISTWEGPSG